MNAPLSRRRFLAAGFVPIETLRMGRLDYDSFIAIKRILRELRRALDEVPEV